MKPRPNVALIVETSVVYGRQILHGIARYLREHGSWSVFLDERELLAPPPDWLLDWDGDGVICRSTTPDLAEALRRRGVPVVDLNDRFPDLGLPRVDSDMPALGRLAAEHLLDHGFHSLAFCGFGGEPWSRERLAGVRAALEGRGELAGAYETPWSTLREQVWQEERGRIADWLRGLPRPLGVVACNDVRGYHVLDACRFLDVAVPDEVAVVGVDNADTFCELCDPPLSSVLPDAEGIGFEAARMLDGLMRGEPPAAAWVRVAPKGIIARESSDAVAVESPVVARAMGLIRKHACERLTVDELAVAVSASRSTLERAFRRHLGHSPQEEIRRVRLKRVCGLLTDTDLSLTRIADRTGFDHPEYMMVQFKRLLGQTPTEYRAAHRRGGPTS